MYPVAFKIGSLTVYTYGLCLAFAFAAATLLTAWRARGTEVTRSDILDLAIIIIITSIVGARFFYVVIDWEYYWAHPMKIINLPEGGLVFYGGLVGAIAGSMLFCLFRKIHFLVLADLISPGILIGQSIGRLGCFLNGCCYGMYTKSPVGIVFNGVAGHDPRHPTQLYSSAANFLLCLLLLYIERRWKRFTGYTFYFYLLLYGAFRFSIEFFRDDDRGGLILGLLSVSQFISLVGIFLAVAAACRQWQTPRISTGEIGTVDEDAEAGPADDNHDLL